MRAATEACPVHEPVEEWHVRGAKDRKSECAGSERTARAGLDVLVLVLVIVRAVERKEKQVEGAKEMEDGMRGKL